MATVDGVVVAPTGAGNVVQGDGGAVDRMAGGAGKDTLQGHAEFNQYYGGGGSDTFILAEKYASDANTSATATDFSHLSAYVTDFQGAGGWAATDNDFLSLQGFGAGATLSLIGTHSQSSANAPSAVLYTYEITYHDAAHVDLQHYTFLLNSVNGLALGAGDYALS